MQEHMLVPIGFCHLRPAASAPYGPRGAALAEEAQATLPYAIPIRRAKPAEGYLMFVDPDFPAAQCIRVAA
jgi:hypothetical protein